MSPQRTQQNETMVLVKPETEWQTAKSRKVAEEKRVEEKRREAAAQFPEVSLFLFSSCLREKGTKNQGE